MQYWDTGECKHNINKSQDDSSAKLYTDIVILLTSGFNMVYTEEDLYEWKVEDLRKFLSDRGVPLRAGSCRKAQLIEKVIYAEKLELPVFPSKQGTRNSRNI